MNNCDLIFSIIFLLAFLYGVYKGFAYSLLQSIGVILSFGLIIKFGPLVKIGLMEKLALAALPATIIAYLLIFVTIAILIRIIMILVNRIVKLLSLIWLDKFLGGVFNLISCLIVLLIILQLIMLYPEPEQILGLCKKSRYIVFLKRILAEFELIL